MPRKVRERIARKELSSQRRNGFADTAKLGRTSRRPFQANKAEAAQDEQQRQRDDEGWQAGLQHDLRIQPADEIAKAKVSRIATAAAPARRPAWPRRQGRRTRPSIRSKGRTRPRSSAAPRRRPECRAARPGSGIHDTRRGEHRLVGRDEEEEDDDEQPADRAQFRPFRESPGIASGGRGRLRTPRAAPASSISSASARRSVPSGWPFSTGRAPWPASALVTNNGPLSIRPLAGINAVADAVGKQDGAQIALEDRLADRPRTRLRRAEALRAMPGDRSKDATLIGRRASRTASTAGSPTCGALSVTIASIALIACQRRRDLRLHLLKIGGCRKTVTAAPAKPSSTPWHRASSAVLPTS